MSASTEPIWAKAVVLPLTGRRLREDITCDVCVVGAGIAGLSVAYRLIQEGMSVAVLEAKPEAGAGETAATSAHLSSVIDDRFARVKSTRGLDAARSAYLSHAAAVDRIERTVREEKFACGFERVDGFLFPGDETGEQVLQKEADVCREANIPVTWVDSLPWKGVKIGPALRFPNQAAFQPREYLAGLGAAVPAKGGTIFTDTRVDRVTGGNRPSVRTAEGHTVSARSVVLATNTPINSGVGINVRIASYTTYVVAAPVSSGRHSPGLFWDTSDPYHYVRFHTDTRGESFVLVGGEDHRTGQKHDQVERWQRLEEWTRDRFALAGPVRYRWDGQVYETLDGLAFIGQDPGEGENVYLATGDSGMGLTHGTIAGELLTDLILRRPNPWAPLYDPSRLPIATAGTVIQEALSSAVPYLDWLPGEGPDPAELGPGEGTVVQRGLKKVAVCRTESGDLCAMRATCPHYGGVVRWNAADQTWDCPLHGSRFRTDGRVIHGPATTDLKPVSLAAVSDPPTGLTLDEATP
jgi:glycine/D-amino acid oxidase-like deaminating enzyme/nitrite reductase/ring-hydroxylating ferredoxin subunit